MESEDSSVNDLASFVSLDLTATPSRATRSSSNGRAWASWKRAVSSALPAASKRKMSLFSSPRPLVKPEGKTRLSQSAKMPAVSSASASTPSTVPTSAAAVRSSSQSSRSRDYNTELAIHPSVYAHLQFMARDDVEPASSSRSRAPQAHETCRCLQDQLTALILDVPPDMPLVRYLGECLLQAPPPSQAHDLTEWQLFFRCLQIHKWSICQIVAERMQLRQVQAGLQQRSSIFTDPTTRSDHAPPPSTSNRSSMNDNQAQAQAAVDAMLSSFLNQCAA